MGWFLLKRFDFVIWAAVQTFPVSSFVKVSEFSWSSFISCELFFEVFIGKLCIEFEETEIWDSALVYLRNCILVFCHFLVAMGRHL